MGRPGLLENGVGTMLDVNLRQMCPQFLLQRFLEREAWSAVFSGQEGWIVVETCFF